MWSHLRVIYKKTLQNVLMVSLQGTPEASFVKGPLWLGVAARWAAAAAGGNRPLVASAPVDTTTCLLIGVPPRYEQEPKK